MKNCFFFQCTSLASEWLGRLHSYLVCIMDQCLVNLNISAPRIRAIQMVSKTQNGNFSKMSVTVLIKFQHFTEPISLNKTA
jgi:hypothetical protein